MAVRSDYQEAPEVEPSLDAPNDYSRAQPGRGATSAAEGLGALGAGLLDASKFYGQVAADNGTNNTLEQVTHVLHGDPNKMVLQPDGTMAPDTGFFGKRGADAMSARAETDQQIKEIIDENRANLSTPQARLQYDTETRRYRAQWQTQMGSHADEQQKVWANTTYDTRVKVKVDQLARDPLNPDNITQSTNDIVAALKNKAALSGEDPAGAELAGHQMAAETQVKSLLLTHPLEAKKAFDANGPLLASTPGYYQLGREVRSAYNDAAMVPFVNSFTAGALSDAQSRVSVGGTDVSSSIGTQEWRGKGPAPTSIDGAVGPSQIKPETARQYGLDPSKLHDPDYAKFARDTIISKISADPKVNGDPARIAVGYFSGIGNVAPAGSPTPYVHDYADGNGKKVSGYVSDVTGRIQAYPTTADALNASRGDIYARAEAAAQQQFPDDPVEQQNAVTHIMNGVQMHVTQLNEAAMVDSHIVEAKMATTNAITLDQLMTDPDTAAAMNRMAVENPQGYIGLQNRLNANAHGAAINFGGQYSHFFDLVTRPPNDPQAITRPDQLNTFVGHGKNALLTNTGIGTLSQLTALNNGPAGHTQVAQIRQFMTAMHGNLSFSNAAAGLVDPKGEDRFAQFSSVAIPALISAAKSGQLPQLLDPKSPNYVGNMTTPFLRTEAEKLNDRVNGALHVAPTSIHGNDSHAVTQQLRQIPDVTQRQQALREAIRAGRVPRAVAEKILIASGWMPAAAPAASAPANTDDDIPFEQ